jgi:hypothetical protein
MISTIVKTSLFANKYPEKYQQPIQLQQSKHTTTFTYNHLEARQSNQLSPNKSNYSIAFI